MEKWQNINGYEGLYIISTSGKIKSLKYNKILKPNVKHDGYVTVVLSKNSKTKAYRIHRLVAEAFIPDKTKFKSMPDEDRSTINLDDLQINHKDENKANNCVENLEWCTKNYNINYGARSHKCMLSRGTSVKCIETR